MRVLIFLLLLFHFSIAQSFQIETGTYTGNGANDRTITTTLDPSDASKNAVVMVKGRTAQYGLWRTDKHAANASSGFMVISDVSDGIKSFTTNGFVVDVNASVNSNTITYDYVVMVADSSLMQTISYIGDAGDRDIATSVTRPEMVWGRQSGAGNMFFKTAEMLGDTSMSFYGQEIVTNIKSMSANTVGVGSTMNGNAISYQIIIFGFNTVSSFHYNGNSASSRIIPFTALSDVEFVHTGATASSTPGAMQTTNSGTHTHIYNNNAGYAGSKILSWDDASITVDGHGLVNLTGREYYGFALSNYTVPATDTEKGFNSFVNPITW